MPDKEEHQHEHRPIALTMEFHEDGLGKHWVSCDSVYDLYQRMADEAPDQDSPLASAFRTLANGMRSFTTYAQLDGTAPAHGAEDEIVVEAVDCPSCGAPVATAKMHPGIDPAESPVTVDFRPHPDGTLAPACSATDKHPELRFITKKIILESGADCPAYLRIHVCGQE